MVLSNPKKIFFQIVNHNNHWLVEVTINLNSFSFHENSVSPNFRQKKCADGIKKIFFKKKNFKNVYYLFLKMSHNSGANLMSWKTLVLDL